MHSVPIPIVPLILLRRISRLLLIGTAICLGGLATVEAAFSQQQEFQAIEDDASVRARQLFVRGLTRSNIADYEGALTVYEEALRLAPDTPAILSALADTYEALDDLPTARYYAEQARLNAPDEPAYGYALAKLYVRAGSTLEAIGLYEAILERFPSDIIALEELAQLQSVTGRNADAIATYDRLTTATGEAARYRRRMLPLLFRMEDTAGALRVVEALVEEDPYQAPTWRLLGELHLKRHAPEAALQAFEQAYQIDPTDAETVMALSDLYLDQGLEERAEALLEVVADVDSASVDELLARGMSLYLRAEDDEDAGRQATGVLRRVLEASPGHSDALNMLGDLYYWASDYENASVILERALLKSPRDPVRWERAAESFRVVGQAQRAAELADEGLLLFPGRFSLLRTAALSHMATSQPLEAIARFEEALQVLRDDTADVTALRAEIYEHLGDLHIALGEDEAARSSWRQALDLTPNNASLQRKLERQ